MSLLLNRQQPSDQIVIAQLLRKFSVIRCALLLVSVLTLQPLALQAAQPQTVLASVNAQRLQSYQLQMQFHLLSLEEADPRVASQMRETVELFAQQTEQLDELSAGLALDAEVETLQAQARDFQQWIMANEVLNQGWVSAHTLNAMSASGTKLNQAYTDLLIKLRAQGGVDEPLQEQAILMQQIAAGYVRETSSLDGGDTVYDQARDLELPVDQLAAQFRQQMSLLQQQYADTAEIQQRLQQVAISWKYIEQSLLNYKEKAVPSTVVRSGKKIIDALLKPTGSVVIAS